MNENLGAVDNTEKILKALEMHWKWVEGRLTESIE